MMTRFVTWLLFYLGGLILVAAGGVTFGLALATAETTCNLLPFHPIVQPIILALCGGYVMGSMCEPEWSRPPRSTSSRWPWDWCAVLCVIAVAGWLTGGPVWALLFAVMGVGSTAAQLVSDDRATPDGREAPSEHGGAVSGAGV
jgi:hypothetical protein